jgi:hypothetical protein
VLAPFRLHVGSMIYGFPYTIAPAVHGGGPHRGARLLTREGCPVLPIGRERTRAFPIPRHPRAALAPAGRGLNSIQAVGPERFTSATDSRQDRYV